MAVLSYSSRNFLVLVLALILGQRQGLGVLILFLTMTFIVMALLSIYHIGDITDMINVNMAGCA
jgi:hypothetical protein